MAIIRERPYLNSNFRVDFGDGDTGAVSAGFAEVVFPDFRIDASPGRRDDEPADGRHAEAPGSATRDTLILKRGVIGALDLYAWWDRWRTGRAPKRRTVKVELLSEDHASVVLTWRFINARPVHLRYSPLRAMDGAVLMESLEIAFDSVEME